MTGSSSEDPHRLSRALLFALLALLVWAPLPLGSNRPWAWAILIVWATLLMIAWLLAYLAGRVDVTPVFRRARWLLLPGAGWLTLLAAQSLPLPATWVEALSPHAHAIHALTASGLGNEGGGWQTISLDPHATRVFLAKSLAYAEVFILVLLLVSSRPRVERVLQVLVLSGTLQALYGSLMVMSGIEYGFFHEKTVGIGVATGTFINRNHYAAYLNLCLAAGMGLMIAKLGGEATHTFRQWLRSIIRLLLGDKTRLRACLVIMVIGLVMTHSRMGNTAFFAGTLIAGMTALLLMKNAPRSTMIFLTSVIALDVFIVGAWFGVEKVTQRIEETAVVASAGNVLPTETRDEVDRYAWNLARDYLLTGSGAGSFYVVFPAYSQRDVVGFYDHAHNDYLQFVAETGVIGTGLAASLVLIAAGLALRTLRQRHDPLARGTAFAVTLALCWAAIHSTVDFSLQIPAIALTFVVFLALASIAAYLDRRDLRGR